jgi:hypothetical protein
MPKTYRVGHRSRRSRRAIIFAVFLLVVGGGIYYAYTQFQKDTQPVIHNSPGSTHAQDIPNSQTKHFDQGVFAYDAPADWSLLKHDTAPYDLYSYRSTLKNADNRYLDIYVDKIPLSLAVNKAVAVRAQGNNLSHGQASDNCTTFTNGGHQTAGQQQFSSANPLTVAAKWDGVEFICDNDNTTRNVIGTSSPGNINKVTLTSLTTGLHSFFFVYTDNNSTPDYSIFYKMLETFIVK